MRTVQRDLLRTDWLQSQLTRSHSSGTPVNYSSVQFMCCEQSFTGVLFVTAETHGPTSTTDIGRRCCRFSTADNVGRQNWPVCLDFQQRHCQYCS